MVVEIKLFRIRRSHSCYTLCCQSLAVVVNLWSRKDFSAQRVQNETRIRANRPANRRANMSFGEFSARNLARNRGESHDCLAAVPLFFFCFVSRCPSFVGGAEIGRERERGLLVDYQVTLVVRPLFRRMSSPWRCVDLCCQGALSSPPLFNASRGRRHEAFGERERRVRFAKRAWGALAV